MSLDKGRTYKLKNAKSGTLLDKSGTDGVSIIGWEDNGGDNQKWIVDQEPGHNEWTIRNVQTGQYLSVSRSVGPPDNGTPLIASNERFGWDIYPDEEHQGFRIFVPGGRHPGINIDLGDHGNPNNGTPVTLWGKYRAGVNQVWQFVPAWSSQPASAEHLRLAKGYKYEGKSTHRLSNTPSFVKPPSKATMRIALAAVFVSLLATTVSAQGIRIGAPKDGSTISSGQKLTVEVDRPNTLTNSEEVSIVISMVDCGNDACPDPSQRLGSTLYKGDYHPQYPSDPNAPHIPHQNFTVDVPGNLTKGGNALLSVVHLSLAGTGPFPLFQIKNATLKVD